VRCENDTSFESVPLVMCSDFVVELGIIGYDLRNDLLLVLFRGKYP
jgi:hypothetical protein